MSGGGRWRRRWQRRYRFALDEEAGDVVEECLVILDMGDDVDLIEDDTAVQNVESAIV